MKKVFFAGSFLRILLAALVLGIAAFPVEAEGFLSRLSWFGEGSIMFFPEANEVDESDPMPILPSIGAGASYPVTNMFSLELTLDVYSTHYGFNHNLNRPVPLAIENRTARVTGILLGFQAAGHFDVSRTVTVRAYGGLAADLRIVVVAAGLTEGLDDMDAIRRDTELVRSYFWSQGRWLLPFAGVGADYTLNSGLRIGLSFRVWMPAYRLWTGEDLPAIEGWRFGPGIRLTFR